jgi:hypothetical protein
MSGNVVQLRPQAVSLLDAMSAMMGAGYPALIPLGGNDGKKPLVRGWHSHRLALKTVTRRLEQARSKTYGVRLDGLLVVDLDTNNEATRLYVDEAFPSTPFVVRTGRGEHRYYRHKGPAPKAIRTDEIAIDFKAGPSAFVVGPGSVRPDGREYVSTARDIPNVAELPLFREYRVQPKLVGSGKVPEGNRNTALYQRAVEYAPMVDEFEDLLGDLTALRDIEFDDAASVPDSEILKVAKWAWHLRLEGRLWSGRNSEVRINRLAMDLLFQIADGPDAFALYSILVANHGHHPSKEFAIAPDAMLDAGLIKMSRSGLYRARKILVDVGLIENVRPARRGSDCWLPDQFRLVHPSIANACKGEGREVSKIILMTNMGHGNSGEMTGGVA